MENTIEKGIESLKEAVRRDCAKAALQFSETGCGENKCSRGYCDKFKCWQQVYKKTVLTDNTFDNFYLS